MEKETVGITKRRISESKFVSSLKKRNIWAKYTYKDDVLSYGIAA